MYTTINKMGALDRNAVASLDEVKPPAVAFQEVRFLGESNLGLQLSRGGVVDDLGAFR